MNRRSLGLALAAAAPRALRRRLVARCACLQIDPRRAAQRRCGARGGLRQRACIGRDGRAVSPGTANGGLRRGRGFMEPMQGPPSPAPAQDVTEVRPAATGIAVRLMPDGDEATMKRWELDLMKPLPPAFVEAMRPQARTRRARAGRQHIVYGKSRRALIKSLCKTLTGQSADVM